MMRIPTVWWTNISAMLFGFGMYSVMIVVPAFLQTPSSAGYGFGASITQSGLALLPLSARDAGRRHPHGRVLDALRLEGAARGRIGLQRVGMLFLTVAHGSEWNFYVAMALVGLRHRVRVLGDVEPRRRGGAADARPASRPA